MSIARRPVQRLSYDRQIPAFLCLITTVLSLESVCKKVFGMKVGDIVKLKSGGPEMVIIVDQGENESGHYFSCEWFDANGKYEHRDFLESSLVILDSH